MIQIINTGVANIRSLQAAFDRLGQAWNLTTSADQIESASHVVLPGVGAFAAAAEALDRYQLREATARRLANPEQATLCICLGMQLLCRASEESPDIEGLGILPSEIKRFPDELPVPQLGWNTVTPSRADTLGHLPYKTGEAYFANSFRLIDPPPADWGYAQTEYGSPFFSSLWRGRTLACQFHPELSGDWGQQVLEHWILGKKINRDANEETPC